MNKEQLTALIMSKTDTYKKTPLMRMHKSDLEAIAAPFIEPTPDVFAVNDLPERQSEFLAALINANDFGDTPLSERFGKWIPYSAARENSKTPHGLPNRAVGGVTKGLMNRGFIETAWGDEHVGKHIIIVKINEKAQEVIA